MVCQTRTGILRRGAGGNRSLYNVSARDVRYLSCQPHDDASRGHDSNVVSSHFLAHEAARFLKRGWCIPSTGIFSSAGKWRRGKSNPVRHRLQGGPGTLPVVPMCLSDSGSQPVVQQTHPGAIPTVGAAVLPGRLTCCQILPVTWQATFQHARLTVSSGMCVNLVGGQLAPSHSR
jgi:hypothetical protein